MLDNFQNKVGGWGSNHVWKNLKTSSGLMGLGFPYSQVSLKDRIVGEWKEKSRCKFFYGIEESQYGDFLDNFCKSAKIDKNVRKDFEQLYRSSKMSDDKKVFKLEGTDSSGTFGMYMAVKNDEV